MDEQGTVGNAVRGAAKVWVPIAVIAALLAVGAVEAIAHRSLEARETVEPGTVIEFGAQRDVAVEVGEGWQVDKDGTKVDFQVTLVSGETTVTLYAVQFARAEGPPTEQMWDGFDRVLDTARHGGTSIELAAPSSFTTPGVTDGLSADLTIGDRSGTAYVLPSADHLHAVYGQVLAGTGDEAPGVAPIIESIAFTEEDA